MFQKAPEGSRKVSGVFKESLGRFRRVSRGFGGFRRVLWILFQRISEDFREVLGGLRLRDISGEFKDDSRFKGRFKDSSGFREFRVVSGKF